jgi:hypothetical protein
MGGRVDGQQEEQALNVKTGFILWKEVNQAGDMFV